MTILLPLTIILAGIVYFSYQTYQWAKKKKYQYQIKKPSSETELINQAVSYQRPLCFTWKDHLLMKIFGRKTWIRHRQGYTRARFAINFFYPTCWIGFYCLFSVLFKLLSKVFWQMPLNWFFWANLVALPIYGLILFHQLQRLKQIPLKERSSRHE